MGCFGYICKECGTSIRGNCFTGGEKCVMIHVRHGKEMGRVEGHYDEYGRVIEQEGLDEEIRFRGDGRGINGHREICNSEFNMEDSYENIVYKRVYNGKVIDFRHFVRQKFYEDFEKVDYCKYFVQLILYLDGSANLKVMYYNEVVRDKKSMDIDYTVGKLNRYVHDFESLMR